MLQLYFSCMEKKQTARLRAVLTSTPQKRHCKGSEQSPFLYVFKQMTFPRTKKAFLFQQDVAYGVVMVLFLCSIYFFNESDEFKFKALFWVLMVLMYGIPKCLITAWFWWQLMKRGCWPSQLVQNVVNLACFLLEGFFSSDKDVLEMPNLDCHCHPHVEASWGWLVF